MAALSEICHNSKKPSKEIFSELFLPEDKLNQPCDVVLVVEDGKQFQAHRQVLSEASPFFEKLLNSDMKESKEGVVRLEMFSESVMRNTLEFIYTGNVQILTGESARDLIVMADYLFLQNLKPLAEKVLLQSLNFSNCFSNYHLSERYRCEELFSKTQKFILANFSAVYADNRIEVLNMSNREIEMFISSDEINVNAEEDVFNIILSWIDHDKSKRKKYFAALFGHVRLVYVSRDILCKNIVTNDLVKGSEGCLDLVDDAMKLIESRDFRYLTVTPRKSLETSVIVIELSEIILCYFPREDKWCNLGRSWLTDSEEFVSCCGNLYTLDRTPDYIAASRWRETLSYERRLVRYNPFSNGWMLLPYSGNKTYRDVHQIFVIKEHEMYALESVESLPGSRERKEKHVFFITKYKPESNSWEDISSFDLGRRYFCIVAKDDFIYFIGGAEYENGSVAYLTDVDRYDLRKDQWDKVADIHEGFGYHWGAAVNEKIFVAGWDLLSKTNHCEVYDETTDEWQVIASLNGNVEKLLAVDGKMYAVCSVTLKHVVKFKKVECYDPFSDKWNLKNVITVRYRKWGKVCSMRIYKEFLADHQLESFIPDSLPRPLNTRSSCPRSSSKCKCLVI
ncbi:hypothetical protein ACROYT_G038330 [Oculina patagonica]